MSSEIVLYVLLGFFALLFLCPILDLVFYIVSWLFIFVVTRFYSVKKTYERPSKFSHSLLIFGYRIICRMGRVKIHYTGKELLPDGTFLFVSNHLSKFDNMVHSVVLKERNLAFVSKPENFKIPMGGRLIKRNCYISLLRGNGKSAIEMIGRTTELLKNDICSIGIFPEGTRGNGEDLLPFKPGVLKIAERASCPVVVGVTRNTQVIHKNWPIHKTHVYFDIVKVFSAEEVREKSSADLSAEIEALVREHFYKNGGLK